MKKKATRKERGNYILVSFIINVSWGISFLLLLIYFNKNFVFKDLDYKNLFVYYGSMMTLTALTFRYVSILKEGKFRDKVKTIGMKLFEITLVTIPGVILRFTPNFVFEVINENIKFITVFESLFVNTFETMGMIILLICFLNFAINLYELWYILRREKSPTFYFWSKQK